MSAQDLSTDLLEQLGLDEKAAIWIMSEITRLRRIISEQQVTISTLTGH